MFKTEFSAVILGAVLFAAVILMPASGAGKTVLRTEFQDITPKFVRLSDGRVAGLSYELMLMIQRRSGIEFRYLDEPVPIRVTMDLDRGRIDVQVGLQKTPERERMFIFGEPLYRASEPSRSSGRMTRSTFLACGSEKTRPVEGHYSDDMGNRHRRYSQVDPGSFRG